MTPKTKTAIEEAAKLPTAEDTLNEFYPTEYINPSLKTVLVAAIESHTAAHTAALRERLENLSGELILSEDTIKHQADRYLRLLEQTKQLEAKIASYESAIDGLKKVVDSLYNLKS